jgi:hypothetical protein
MPHNRKPRKPKQPRSRFFTLDGSIYLITDRDDEQLYAIRLTGEDRELVLHMTDENEVEMESRIAGGWR